MKVELINYLKDFSTDDRFNLFQEKVSYRTNYISVLLEDIFQSQNASAVLRTSDCFGVQNVHIVENKHEYNINPDVCIGADKWLNLNYYSSKNGIKPITNKLKEEGYRIIATTPHTDDIELQDFNIEKSKFILCFGSEKTGISEALMNEADEYLKIPMYGFSESMNISVSAAISMHHLTLKIRNSNLNWQLTDSEKNTILLDWLKKSIKSSKMLIEEFGKKNNVNVEQFLK